MLTRRLSSAVAVGVWLLTTWATAADLPGLAALNAQGARLSTISDQLSEPWAFAFIGPDQAIVTEIRGRLCRLDFRTGHCETITGLPPIATAHEQTGLLDIALHPQFASNQRLYFSFSQADEPTGKYFRTAIAMAQLEATALTEVKVILTADPFGWSPSNFGGALAFDDDGYLYATIGDRSEHELAQRGDRLQGKVLRLHDDGKVPADNPFVGNPNIDDRIYALGVRNPQGLVFDTVSGRLLEAEHGPVGGDEINIIEAGANYGWPTITYGGAYVPTPVGEGTHKAGLKQPLFYFLPSIATSPLAIYRGEMFAAWDGDLLVGALKGQHIAKLDLDGDRIRSSFRILEGLRERVRDIKVHDDGSIYVLTQAGKLYRVWLDPAAIPVFESDLVKPETVYQMVCSGCHENQLATGAPGLNDPTAWQQIAADREASYQRLLNGFGAMPARGLCDLCSDDDLRETLDWMIDQSLD